MIQSNYSISRLFVSKTIDIVSENKTIQLILRPVRDFYLDKNWNMTYHIWTAPRSVLKKMIMTTKEEVSSLEVVKTILFNLGQFDKFRHFYTLFREQLETMFVNCDINMTQKQIIVNGNIITDEIWEYVLYLLKLSCGEKVEKPISFDSEEARQFYLAQKAAEEKIKAVKAKNQVDEDSLIKTMLSIIYAFPSITIDYLYDQTMAQIQWLQKYAAGSVSYEVNAKAFAAGNMKNGKKLDFFIK